MDVAVPTVKRVSGGLKTWGYGALAGQAYRLLTIFTSRFTNSLPYGSLIAAAGVAAVTGAVVKGEESRAITAFLGFQAGQQLNILDRMVGAGAPAEADSGPAMIGG